VSGCGCDGGLRWVSGRASTGVRGWVGVCLGGKAVVVVSEWAAGWEAGVV
jgi:hypothetical protein